VAFEAAYGWGWLVELLEDYGFAPHLVHPLRCKAIASARLKNDKVDAATLAQLLRADLLPEAWIAPLHVRQLRALLRHRLLWSGCAPGCVTRSTRSPPTTAMTGPTPRGPAPTGQPPGRRWLEQLSLPAVSRQIITDNLAAIDAIAPTIDHLDREVHVRAKADPQVKVLTALPGVGEFTAMVLLAEIGDISRFSNARRLASWAGLNCDGARVRPGCVHHGHIWKAGLAVRAVGACAGGADRQAAARVRRHLPADREPARQEDRHRCGGTQAADPRASAQPRHALSGRRGDTQQRRRGDWHDHPPGGQWKHR
jgi:transposase